MTSGVPAALAIASAALSDGRMFPALPAQDTTKALLLASTAAAMVLVAATRGRLGYRPDSLPGHRPLLVALR
jgi:hypothetical protein